MWRIGPIGALIIVAAAVLSGLSERPTRPVVATQSLPTEVAKPVVPPPARPAFLFSPTAVRGIRRVPHVSRMYSFAPPGGPLQYQAVTATRSGDCSAGMTAIYRALERSADFAPLFKTAWLCFNVQHQQALLGSQALTLREFESLEAHFRGPQRGHEAPGIPQWQQDPLGGLEYRLQAFMGYSEASALLREAVTDIFGPARVTDTIAQDVQLLLDAAVALAESRESSEERDQLWAHYVYWATRVLDSPVISDLLRKHRSGDIRGLEEQYELATTPAHSTRLPPDVVLAMELGVSP